jgi:hypothetical protein
VAHGLPAPRVTARVLGRGRSRTLAYAWRPAPGRQVVLVEHGARTYRELGRARGARGRIRIAPSLGRAGVRDVRAIVSENGVPVRELVVARYRAPAPARPAAPRRVTVRHSGTGLTVRWRRAPAAASYAVVAQLADGRRIMRLTTRRSVSFGSVPAAARGRVLVAGVRADGLQGRPARRAFRAVRHRRRHRQRRHGR